MSKTPASRFVRAHQALRENKILGDVGLGAGVGLVVACVMYFYGGGEAVWGLPISLVFGGVAFVAAFALSASLGLIPDQD